MQAITIVGLAFAAAGAPMLWLASRAFARDRTIARWPRASGVVTSATLETSTHRYTDNNTGLHSYGTLYTPVVTYTYTVGGETFDGTCIARSLDRTAMDEKSAKRITQKYAPKTEVAVLYDSSDPKTAYLETRLSIGAVILFGMGLVFFGLGTVLVTLSLT